MDELDIGGAVSDYLKANDAADAARRNVTIGVQSDPDLETELRRVSARTGVPLDSVRAFPDETKRQARLATFDFGEMAQNFPATTAYLGNLNNARIAHDDVDSLTNWEGVVADKLVGLSRGLSATGNFLADAGKRVVKGALYQAPAGFWGIAAGVADTLQQGIEALGGSGVRRIGDPFRALAMLAERGGDAMALHKPEDNIEAGVASGFESLGQNLITLPAGVAMQSYKAATALMAASAGGQSYMEATGKGKSPIDAMVLAGPDAAAEYFTEQYGMKELFAIPGVQQGVGALLKGIANFVVKEGIGEQVATLWQDFNRWMVLNPEKTADEYLEERPDAAIRTAIATVIGGGGQVALVSAIKSATGDARQAQTAGKLAEVIGELNKIAEASKARERDPASAREFFQSVLENDGIAEVWITPRALAQSGLGRALAQAVPDVAAQIDGAVVSGHDIRLPVADLMASMAGPQLETLAPLVAMEPGGFSALTAQAYLQSSAVHELQAEVEQALVQKGADDVFEASQQTVKQQVLDRLNQIGRFTSEKNEADATLISSYAAARAAQLGVTPEAFFGSHMLNVVAEQIGGQNFAQSYKDFFRLFDDTGRVVGAGDVRRMSDEEVKRAEDEFLSHFPEGSRYPHDTRLLERIRHASEAAANDLGGSAETERTHAGPLGPFSGYATRGVILPGDSFDPGGRLEVHVYGKEQAQHGFTGEPALTFTVSADGGLAVNGPIPSGDTFRAFQNKGWAARAVGAEGVPQEGWSALRDPQNPGKPMSVQQMMPLLADVHARTRLWMQRDRVGLHWTRATGALGGLFGDNPTAIFFQTGEAPRGAFQPETNTIALLTGANLSTFLHETGHYFFETDIGVAAELASRVEPLTTGERQILADVHALMAWHGIQGDIGAQLGQWYAMNFEERRSYHERTAESFEAYLMEGKAPSIELQGYFQRFRGWLISVYTSAKQFLARYPEAGTITDGIRQVFDRMLATERQIELAQYGRSMLPLFQTQERAGMTPDEYAAYQELDKEAGATAADELTTRSLRDMKWLHGARAKAIKALQKEAFALRQEVEMEVRGEVMSQPIYRAWTFLTAKLTPDDHVGKGARAGSPEYVDETRDSMFVAIAKLGGIDRDQLIGEWGMDPAEKARAETGFGGKRMVDSPKGRSIDDMGMALAERGYLTTDDDGRYDMHEFEEKFFDSLRGTEHYSYAFDYDAANNAKPGEQVRNPSALSAGRLDRASIKVLLLPEDAVKLLDARRMLRNDALHPDLVANLFGFSSGDEMLQKLLAADPPNVEIAGRTDARMLEKYGDLTSADAMERAADKAVHNDVRARFVAAEVNALARATGRQTILTPAAKSLAAGMVARLKLRDIRPSQYANAGARAAKAAVKATDLLQKAAEKRNQLINIYATRAAHDALSEVEAALRYLKKFSKDSKNLDADYADQIHTLLERFDLRQISNRAVDKRAALAEWLKAQQDMGLEPELPADLINEAFRKPYKEMTLEEFRGLVDTVKQIEHLGRLKHKLLTTADNRAYAAARDEIVAGIKEHSRGREANTRTATTNRGRIAQALRRFWAAHIKVGTWAYVMDGGKEGGPVWTYLVRSANERGDRETSMRAAATARLSEIMAPVLKRKMGGAGTYFPSVDRSLNRESRIAIALNIGNEGNLQRLLGGENWTQAQLLPVLESLTPQEWQAVQSIWDYFETYRPLIAEKERRVYGKEPNWIEPGTDLSARFDLRGGYYPIRYDPAASQRAEEHADAESARRQMQGAYTSATTRRSFTKSRADAVIGRPLLYTLSGVYTGVDEVIHDLSWHEWLIDANRLLRSKSIDAAIREHYGPEVKAQFKSWAQDIAEGDNGATAAVDVVLSRLRQGISASGLGFNVMSALIQPLGITQSMVRVGTPWVARGVVKYLAHPLDAMREVNAKSAFMEHRARTRFRELNELRNKVQGQTAFNELVGRYTYWAMMRCQQMADVPTWLGAYEKAIADGADETHAVERADQAVIDSQGSGMTKDMAAIERGGPAQRLFTVFYSFMNTALNVGVAKTMTADTPAKRAKLAVDYLMLYTVPAVLGYALKQALTPGGGDDDDDLEKLARKLIAQQLDYLMGLMVVVREFAEVAKTITGGDDLGRDYTGPAGLRLISDAIHLAKQAYQGEFDDAFRKAAVNVIGDATGLPSAQINRSITGGQALAEGRTDNPAALAFGFQKN